MTKKNTATNSVSVSVPASTSQSKTNSGTGKKHVKAKAEGVVAAVESFVNAVVHPAVVKEGNASASPAVTQEEISVLAYQLYLERAGQQGSPADDWMRAEQMLLSGSIK